MLAVSATHETRVEAVTDPGRQRFWRAYLSLGFAVFAGESAAAAVYLWTTPSGPNRGVLSAAATATAIVALACIAPARWVASRPWRARFSMAWGVFAALLLAVCASLDGGLESPLLALSLLPTMFSALALSPTQIGVVGVSTVLGIIGAGVSDHERLIPQESLFMFSAFAAGVIVLSVVAGRHRSALQADDDAMMRELAERAVTDALTGCANQRAFHERLAEEVARATRHQRPLALIVCDVDLFKDFNDIYGHDVGDDTLAAIGARLRASARASDVVARIGGDEFAILMPETSVEDAARVSARIVAPAPIQGAVPTDGAVHLTLSVGVAGLDRDDPTAKRLLRDADQAMFDAKKLGRGRAVIAGPDRRPLHAVGASAGACAEGRRAEAAVRRAARESLEVEGLLEVFLQEAAAGFAFMDCALRVQRINPTFAAALDDPVTGIVGHSVAQIWPELEPLCRRAVHHGEEARNVELADTWLANVFPVHAGRRVIGVGVVILDISDRRRLETAGETLTDAVITALAAAVEVRDPYTAGHQRRVAEIAGAIALDLGLDAFTVKGIEVAGAIHDIGKVGVPAEILSRPGRLTSAEMEIVRTHAEAGYIILRDIEFPWPVAEMVREHHERLNGSGYPRALVGDQISMGGRIIAVADVVEAMASHRPYRAPLGIDAALAHIKECSGTLYDSTVVDACIRLFDAGRLRIRELVVA